LRRSKSPENVQDAFGPIFPKNRADPVVRWEESKGRKTKWLIQKYFGINGEHDFHGNKEKWRYINTHFLSCNHFL
jgi:hypothetical protein